MTLAGGQSYARSAAAGAGKPLHQNCQAARCQTAADEAVGGVADCLSAALKVAAAAAGAAAPRTSAAAAAAAVGAARPAAAARAPEHAAVAAAAAAAAQAPPLASAAVAGPATLALRAVFLRCCRRPARRRRQARRLAAGAMTLAPVAAERVQAAMPAAPRELRALAGRSQAEALERRHDRPLIRFLCWVCSIA